MRHSSRAAPQLMVIFLGLVFGSFAPVLFGRGTGAFHAPMKFFCGTSFFQITPGDFNADGRPDLVALASGELVVFLQDPLSPTGWSPPASVPRGTNNVQVKAADLDGDGDDDLLVADAVLGLYTLASLGNGRFGPPVRLLPPPPVPRWVTVGDWNHDGKIDAASANYGDSSVSVFVGTGDGTFNLFEKLLLSGQPHSIEGIDLDGNGREEMVVGLKPLGVVLLRLDSDDKFSVQTTGVPCYRYLLARDFNADGFGDFACYDLRPGLTLAMSAGNEFRVFTLPEVSAPKIGVGDWNGDRFLDLALATRYSQLQILSGTATGEPGPSEDVPLFSDSSFVRDSVGTDLDGDGLDEFIVLESGRSLSDFQVFRKSRMTDDWGIPVLEGYAPARGFTVGDLGGDRAPDVFILTSSGTVEVYREPGKGSLKLPSLSVKPSRNLLFIEAGDLDGDGHLDLAGSRSTENLVYLAFLDHDGRIREERTLVARSHPGSVRVASVNADGRADLVVPCTLSNQVRLFLGEGGGSFADGAPVPTMEKPRWTALADIDRDGALDLVVSSASEVGVHRGLGDGHFGPLVPAISSTDAYLLAQGVSVGDQDGDGLQDLVIARTGKTESLFLFGKGNLEFEPPVEVDLHVRPESLGLFDLNDDGLLDLTVLSRSDMLQLSEAPALVVLLAHAGRAFQSPQFYGMAASPLGHVIADFDLDGAPDLLACGTTGSVVVLGERAPGERFLRGDTDGNGRLEVNDPILTLSHLFLGGERPPCPDAADADDDGELGLADPLRVLSRLFLGGQDLPQPAACGEDPTPDRLGACLRGC